MSTNSECEFIQTEPDKWYYVLEMRSYADDDDDEDSSYRDNADWRDNAESRGPFATFEAAEKHLGQNYANPGGFSVSELPEGVEALDLTKDPIMSKLIAEAVPANPPRRGLGYFR